MKRIALITALMVFVSLGAAQTSSNIEIDLKKTEPTPLQTSQYADVWLEVSNTGNAEARNVELEFQENYPFTADGKSSWDLETLQPGEEYQVYLQAKVDENAVQGENSLNFRLTSSRLDLERSVPVQVRSDRNVLSIESIEFPERAAPGTSNTMTLELENLADSQLKNIEVSLDVSDDSLPLATSESATKNLDSVEPDETLRLNYTLNIDESAENAVYKLPIDISFENEAGTEFSQSTTTGVNVGGTPDLQAGLNTEEALTDGTREITLRLVNRGHGSADFVSLELQENEELEVIGSNEVYIGSMDPDDFQTASFQVNIDSADEPLQMPVEVSYTDQDGQQTVSRTVEAEVFTQQQLQEYGLSSSNNLLPVVAVVVLVVVGGVFYWRRRKKR